MMLRVREGHACKVWVTVAMVRVPVEVVPPAVESRRSPLDASGMPLSMVPKKSVACATEPSHHAMGQRYG